MPQRRADLPLIRRFPALATVPRAALGTFPTAVERVQTPSGTLLLKRDDLSAERVGGNKVRGLEFLLGGLAPGERVLTVGPLGSTHALATAVHAGALGARVTVVRWPQEMHDAARQVDARIRAEAEVLDAWNVTFAYLAAFALRARSGARWIPAGGATPLAVLGHVNAALELVEQILAGECVEPDVILVPLGTGGTAAGLALGLRIAGLATRVRPVRVVPQIVGRAARVASLANSGARLIERLTRERLPRLRPSDVAVEHAFFGGGYGRPLQPRPPGEDALAASGVRLDDTYSRKAFAAAAASAGKRPMLWLTFDGRLLQDSPL